MSKPTKNDLPFSKSKDFSSWYLQILTNSDLIEPYHIRGLIIMKPSSMFIWSQIQKFIKTRIQEYDVQEAYFPMLITKDQLEKEKSHIENFQPEVAWITKSGANDIEPLAIRPTSETVMYPYFSKFIRSHRDLPYKINQFCNILRWEVKSTVPFIRGREFLWQEGHCAYEKKIECEKEVLNILELYYDVYKELLAVPVIKGKKSENEKFGGADYTLTVEAFIKESGRAVQAATSHNLGQNFAKMFDIKANDFVYQSSWGLTTRSIGVAVMTHSDENGLVLSPRIANFQIVIVPCGKLSDELKKYIDSIKENLRPFRVRVDYRDNITVGSKFYYWEIRGVPLRIEVGLRDAKENKIVVVPRNSLEKKSIGIENIKEKIGSILDEMHNSLYEKAKEKLYASIIKVNSWEEFIKKLNENNMILMKWCNTSICEENIKEESNIKNDLGDVAVAGAKSLCIPFEFNNEKVDGKCMKCEKDATCIALFGRCY